MLLYRRTLLAAALAAPLHHHSRADGPDTTRLLRQGGVVALFRHAQAPGVYDPPGMRLGDCSTQRNLDDAGRAQARGLGAWFSSRGLQPSAVLSSPWCRCLDTARGAFGVADIWDALGSPSGRAEGQRSGALQTLRDALAKPRPGRFEVWVTHNFVIADLCGVSTASAEGVLLRAGVNGAPQLLARLAPA